MILLKPCMLPQKFKLYGWIPSSVSASDFTFIQCCFLISCYLSVLVLSILNTLFLHFFLLEYYLRTKTEIGKKLKTSCELKVKFLL